MIKEDYVSFETAKLLKEKGFEEPIGLAYWDDGTEIGLSNPIEQIKQQAHHIVFKPTLQMAMKWIREQGFYINVDIDVDYDEDERGTKWYHKPSWDWAVFRIDERKQMSDDGALYATYEQAAEVAIKWCLENLF